MELREVRCFAAVAAELHFGRAAERLGLAQPTVSQLVRRLERELGLQLFDRTPRQVRLTDAGERFRDAAEEILAAEARALEVAAELGGRLPGTFRIGTLNGMGDRLDRMIDAFAARAAGTRVDLVALPQPERLARVMSGRLDAALLRGRQDPAPGVRYIPAWDDELVAALPGTHPLVKQGQATLKDLAGLRLRLPERKINPALVDAVLDRCRSDGIDLVPGPVSARLQDTLATIGAPGPPSWTAVYGGNAERLRISRIAFVPFEPPLTLPVVVAVSPQAARSPLTRLLADAVRE